MGGSISGQRNFGFFQNYQTLGEQLRRLIKKNDGFPEELYKEAKNNIKNISDILDAMIPGYIIERAKKDFYIEKDIKEMKLNNYEQLKPFMEEFYYSNFSEPLMILLKALINRNDSEYQIDNFYYNFYIESLKLLNVLRNFQRKEINEEDEEDEEDEEEEEEDGLEKKVIIVINDDFNRMKKKNVLEALKKNLPEYKFVYFDNLKKFESASLPESEVYMIMTEFTASDVISSKKFKSKDHKINIILKMYNYGKDIDTKPTASNVNSYVWNFVWKDNDEDTLNRKMKIFVEWFRDKGVL